MSNGDLISRKALKEDFKERNIWNPEIISAIDNAPAVESPKGTWIELPDNVDHLKCSVCGDADYYDGYEPKFCPNCGAQMAPGKIPERMELITEHNFIVKEVNYDVKYCMVDGITWSCSMLLLNGDWYFCVDDRYHWYLVTGGEG